MHVADDRSMPTIRDLDGLAELVESHDLGVNLFVRWSQGPEADLSAGNGHPESSKDSLTGLELPGLSANPLRVEPWWGDRSIRLWVARRLYDYRHLRERRGSGPEIRAWVLHGEECGRGPDNEPLVQCHKAIAWIADEALHECEQLIADRGREWGPLDREGARWNSER